MSIPREDWHPAAQAHYARTGNWPWEEGAPVDTFPAEWVAPAKKVLRARPKRVRPLPDGASERWRLYSVEELGLLPASEMLVRPYLAGRELTGLFGSGDTFKTFIAINWACTVAAQGHHAIYIAAEGGPGIRARITAWMIHHDVAALPTLHVMPNHVNLHQEADAWIQEMRLWLPREVNPALVVVDTMARNFVGGDENSTQDQGRFVDGCEEIRRALKTAVLVIHHNKKDDDVERGTEVLRNASFAVLKTIKGKTLLVCDRMKELERPGPSIIHTTPVETPTLGPDPNDPDQVSTSLVVTLTLAEPSSGTVKSASAMLLSKPDQRANQILEMWKTDGRKLSPAETAARLGVRADDRSFKTGLKKAISLWK